MHHRRHYWLVTGTVICMFVLTGRMFYLSIVNTEFLTSRGNDIAVREKPLDALRGNIYDRRGEPLAVSTVVASVGINPAFDKLNDPDIQRISEILDLDVAYLSKKMNGSSTFVHLARGIPPRQADELNALALEGLVIDKDFRRFYPMGPMTAHVIGFTDVDEEGREGIEYVGNQHLSGVKGSRLVVLDEQRRVVRDLGIKSSPDFASDLYLTLDSRLQFQVFRLLEESIEQWSAQAASAIVCDVRSGEILALVSSPSFNPNDTDNLLESYTRNRVVSDLIEPGSTIKPFVALAALESGRYTEDSQFDTSPGYFTVGRKLIEDPNDYGVLSLRGVLTKSSQVGITQLILDLDIQRVVDVVQRAGFVRATNLPLTGESIGQWPTASWDADLTRATFGYGYGISVTQAQLAQAYLTLATDGIRRSFSLIKGQVVSPDIRVINERDAIQIRDMLTSVTGIDGTAHAAAIDGFNVAGKTGTVRKVGATGYEDSRHDTFFVGMVPAEEPKFVVAVVVNEPQGYKVSGGKVAAPLFAAIAGRAIQLIGADNPIERPTLALANDAS